MPRRRAPSPWRSEADQYAALHHGAEQEDLRPKRSCQRYVQPTFEFFHNSGLIR